MDSQDVFYTTTTISPKQEDICSSEEDSLTQDHNIGEGYDLDNWKEKYVINIYYLLMLGYQGKGAYTNICSCSPLPTTMYFKYFRFKQIL